MPDRSKATPAAAAPKRHAPPCSPRGPKVLMIAFHYPPYRGSSSVHRALSFSKYLPASGWQPVVLSAHPRAYPQTGTEQLGEIPQEVEVVRAFALDSARHLAVAGRHLRWTALPDRWTSWALGALPAGLRLIRKHRPDLLWSTYPIATAHWIGAALARLSRIPWIADVRDSMTEPGYPDDPRVRRAFLRIERATVQRAARVVFTAPGAQRMYAARYPDIPAERWALIPNGYDESNLVSAERASAGARAEGPLRLVHSGVLYRSERDPSRFFAALAQLRQAGRIHPENLQVVLRASGDEAYYADRLRELDLESLVRLAPPLPYPEALAELFAADGLLVFQAANCNHQIPAKLYEYLRVGRPILALTDLAGDTAGVLREVGIESIAALDSQPAIAAALVDFLERIRTGRAALPDRARVARHSREARTRELARLFDGVCAFGATQRSSA